MATKVSKKATTDALNEAYVIEKYKFEPQQIESKCEAGGYDKKKKTFEAFADVPAMYRVLDAITAAVEDGFVRKDNWVETFFANEDAFREFLSLLADYDDCFRVRDRWWTALFNLTDLTDEEGFVRSTEIAEMLLEAAEETGQI